MKTYTYSYQNGLCRGREAGRVPAPSSVRVGAYRIRPPDGPERGRMTVTNARTRCRGVLHTPSRRTRKGPNDRNDARTDARTRCRGVLHTPSKRTRKGPNDHTPGTCIRHRWWRPVGRMLLRLLHGYPHQQTNGAQPPTNQHQTGHRPEWMDAGYDHSPRTGSFGGAYAIRPYPTGRRAFQYPAKFAGVRRHPAANAERLAGLPQTPR